MSRIDPSKNPLLCINDGPRRCRVTCAECRMGMSKPHFDPSWVDTAAMDEMAQKAYRIQNEIVGKITRETDAALQKLVDERLAGAGYTETWRVLNDAGRLRYEHNKPSRTNILSVDGKPLMSWTDPEIHYDGPKVTVKMNVSAPAVPTIIHVDIRQHGQKED